MQLSASVGEYYFIRYSARTWNRLNLFKDYLAEVLTLKRRLRQLRFVVCLSVSNVCMISNVPSVPRMKALNNKQRGM
jgi:hypothetical protein